MSQSADEKRLSAMTPLQKVFLLTGFALLAAAVALLLFGEELLQRPSPVASPSVLDQVAPLELNGTPQPLSVEGPTSQSLGVGEQAPPFTLPSLEGESISLADFREGPVMLNFWATWCGPCIFEMPELQAAYEAHQEDGLVILAINRAEEETRVNDFLQNELDVTITFPALLDEDASVANRYQIVNMPTTYFIDGTGTITAVHRGPLTREQIDDYLSGTLQDG